ncbi:MAG TPA: hypothetical protein VMT20_10925 [Terriglobia bacterium]|nr:hypothetical protein [Terriglobia bacterium]
MKKEDGTGEPPSTVSVEIHRRREEFLWYLRKLARSGNEDEFKAYLIESCGLKPGSPRYASALAAFWTAVRDYEHQRRER